MKCYWLRENKEKGEWVSVIASNDKMADVFENDLKLERVTMFLFYKARFSHWFYKLLHV